MLRRIIVGAILVSTIVIFPALGNTEILHAPHLWILLGIGTLASVLQPAYNPLSIFLKTGDQGTGAQIIWSIYLIQLAATLEASYLRYPQSIAWDSTAYLALIGCTIGLFIRTWAVVTLGDLFTMHISIKKDHIIISKGPYALVRHPSYLGAYILYLSAAVLLHAWYAAFVAATLLLPFAFLRRIHFEENRLLEEFGKDYDAYRKTTYKIIPFVL